MYLKINKIKWNNTYRNSVQDLALSKLLILAIIIVRILMSMRSSCWNTLHSMQDELPFAT